MTRKCLTTTCARTMTRSSRLGAMALMLAPVAHADLSDPLILNQLSPLERTAALANQATYNLLTSGPSPICNDALTAPSGSCTGTVFQTFDNVRELVHTANDLNDSGPTFFSLGLDVYGLGEALRWTAAEELAAQRSAATEFSNGQLGALMSRLSALRFGAMSSSTLQFRQEYGSIMTFSGDLPLGLGMAADEGSIARRLSAFISGTFGYGSKRDTTYQGGFEDAFDFDGMQATVGLDYRVNSHIVIGGLLGLVDREIDFDSSASIVDGSIESDGGGLTLYGQWESDRIYVSASIGTQKLNHKITRRITYPSLNPIVPSIDSTALGDTDSTALVGTLGLGYTIRRGGLSIEPFLKSELQNVEIDAFTEVDDGGFAFQYGSQRIESLDTAAGMKAQYVLTPSWGVVVPFLRGEYHHEMQPGSRTISATYGALSALNATSDFSLPTDRRDSDYFQLAGGASVVLRHGLQGFLQYQQTLGLDPFTDRAISGGLRLEF